MFHDDVSGGGDFMKRPGMVAMLNFLDTQAHDGYVVIFDDLKRFARDTISHLKPWPTEHLFRLARAMFEDLWNHRIVSAAAKASALKAELEKTQRSVDQFLDRIADAQLPSVITAYENRIRKLEEQKISLAEKIAHCGRPLRSFDESLGTAMDFLSNPTKRTDSSHTGVNGDPRSWMPKSAAETTPQHTT